MVPKYFVQIDELPMNNNGKVDKKALLQYKIDVKTENNYTSPTNDTEKLFCEIWENLLNTKVGICLLYTSLVKLLVCQIY